MVLTDCAGCGGGGGEENVGGLLINMAEDKGDVKPSDDMSGAGDSDAIDWRYTMNSLCGQRIPGRIAATSNRNGQLMGRMLIQVWWAMRRRRKKSPVGANQSSFQGSRPRYHA